MTAFSAHWGGPEGGNPGIAGEGCEWLHCEYARDAGLLGFPKALIFLGHIPSERDGMIFLADALQKHCPETEVRYFECGESYQTI